MENGIINAPIDIATRNSVVMDEIPNSLVGSDSFDFSNQNHLNRALAGFPTLSALQGEPIGDIHTNLPATNHSRAFDCNALVTSLGRNAIRDVSLGIDNIDFQEHFERGTPISSASLFNLLAARSGLPENLNNLAISGPSIYPEDHRSNIANDFSYDLNSSFATSMNSGYDEVLGNMNVKGDFEKSHVPPEFCGKIPSRTGFQPFSSMGNLHPSGWISTGAHVTPDCHYDSSIKSNELSLSLATTQPPIIYGTNIGDQCSEISCSGETHHYVNATKLESEHSSHNSKELSLSFGSCGPAQFSQLISGSKYLLAIQEILAEIASYSLENLDEMSYLNGERKSGPKIPFFSSSPYGKGMPPMDCDENPDIDGGFGAQLDASLRRRTIEAKKTQLLTLLQLVDERYNQCLDEIHTVVSAFHAVTELDPRMHTRFALRTVSFLYKNLRERISNQILAMSAHFDGEFTKGKEKSFEDSFIKEQWALQQLKKKENQIWRPQRGLPEKSVSILRAWMFQNFLHPYPRDAEKHLLAVKSGLTRSQVSNWFINARVRLWKPMIEEMYRDMNRRKARRNDEGANSNNRRHLSLSNQRFKMN
ncbi:hypothetical protein Patl1_13009 [Pistacia atlantica]|uniref:Uncharacterized protein n=1 Tax=Pistacia atlantica TaxID=434234 RepID=A0ACC1AUD9_9ROSI|nr:hypothetical protein Patl1_13009 [Pistacia atlantica]